MNDVSRLRHSVWECKYHLVWIPKCRAEGSVWAAAPRVGVGVPRIGRQKECCIEEGHLLPGPRACADIDSSKYAVAQVVGFLKGKSAIHIARVFSGRRRNFVGQQFWARGYYVSTVGKDEQAVRQYIREQEVTDRQLDQLNLVE